MVKGFPQAPLQTQATVVDLLRDNVEGSREFDIYEHPLLFKELFADFMYARTLSEHVTIYFNKLFRRCFDPCKLAFRMSFSHLLFVLRFSYLLALCPVSLYDLGKLSAGRQGPCGDKMPCVSQREV